ncbi:MAG: hypothetical protein U0892_02745 [Pirellulales bacterium]
MPHCDLLVRDRIDAELLAVIEAAPIPDLNDAPRDAKTAEAVKRLLAGSVGSQLDRCAAAGLWLLAGDLDASHSLSQEVHTKEGSFWHGIMHRREGDFENAKYWFHRVGRHSVLTSLAEQIQSTAEEPSREPLPWDELTDAAELPFALVDACRTAVRGQSSTRETLREICWWEWQLLFSCSIGG